MTHLEHPASPEDNELPPPDRSVEEYLAEQSCDCSHTASCHGGAANACEVEGCGCETFEVQS
jgi:hypothetical protein